jgi:hypothetical protein
MELYAIKIQKSHLALITLLNGGVTPKVEKQPSYFIFDATWNSDVPNEIVTAREFLQRFEIFWRRSSLFKLNK